MTEREFAYWLQGFAELNAAPPSAEQWQSIREHLATVFTKITPPVMRGVFPADSDAPYVAKRGEAKPLRSECTTGFDPLAGRTTTTC